MKLFIIIFATAIVATSAGMQGRIISGLTSAGNDFLMQAGIFFEGGSFCGGSIISHTWILTAAHCCKDKTAADIYLGSKWIKTGESMRHATSDKFIMHEKYTETGDGYDICLIQIEYTEFTRRVQPARLPKTSDLKKTYEHEKARACGWGRTGDDQILAQHLLCVDMVVPEKGYCNLAYGTNEDLFLCINGVNKKSVCKGDSGGPLTSLKDGTQIGIASFVSSLGCEQDRPMAFTRVTEFVPWIREKTGEDL